MVFAEVINEQYDLEHVSAFLLKYYYVPPIASALYLVIIFGGKKWMDGQNPYKFPVTLVMWNAALALFSIIAFVVTMPSLIQLIITKGYTHAVCNTVVATRPLLSFMGFLFVLSKIVEFGDTFFIVLRKKPLSFLHWYHHVTVLMYSWYGVATRNTAGHWFAALNCGVHAVMYSYYMLKAMKFRIPSSVAMAITALQLAQFVVGLLLIFTAIRMMWQEKECGMNGTHIKAGLIMYGSYFILFLNFAYHRYFKQKTD